MQMKIFAQKTTKIQLKCALKKTLKRSPIVFRGVLPPNFDVTLGLTTNLWGQRENFYLIFTFLFYNFHLIL